jgi:hypothetical protein
MAPSLVFGEAILKGWPSYSPGLTRSVYPGLKIKRINPVRVESLSQLADFNPYRVEVLLLNLPRVGVGTPTLGYTITTPLGLPQTIKVSVTSPQAHPFFS